MGFGGGGSNVTKPHTHDSTIVQDGGSLAANVTQFGLSAGSILYSDGSNIQELAVGSASDTLTVNAGATAPEWAAGGSTWTNQGSDVSTTATAHLEVSGLSDQDVYQVMYSMSDVASATGMSFTCEVNGIVSNTYNSLISAFSYGDSGTQTYPSLPKLLMSNNGANGTAHSGVFYLYKGDANFTANARAYLNVISDDVMFQTSTVIRPITRVITSGNNTSITGAVTSIRLLYRVPDSDVTQNCIGSMQVNSLSY